MTFIQRTPVRWASIVILLILLFMPAPIPLRVLIIAGAVLVWTFLEAGNLGPIGMGRHRPAAIMIWGVGTAIGVILLGQIIEPIIMKMLGLKIDLSSYGALAGNVNVALKLLTYALTSASFGEEIIFRGFLLYQLTSILGTDGRARSVAIVFSGIAFGVAHHPQGPSGILSTGLAGMVLAWVWFRSGRNLWALILAHACIDSFGVAMLFLDWSAF